MAGDPEAQRQVDGPRDTHAGAAGDGEIARVVWRQDNEHASRQICAVVAQRQPERASQIAGPAGQARRAGRHAAAARHGRDPGKRLERADEDTAGVPSGVGDRVQAVVHAVVQIDIRVAAGAVKQMMAAGPEGGVRGLVFGPEVRLDLDDAARRRRTPTPRNDDAPQEVASDGGRRTEIELATKRPRRDRASPSRAARASRNRMPSPCDSAAPLRS
jgi:hypothetical protein